ncbi:MULTISPECIES: helix-turn-helix domain-containing protein [Streptomyces]|uniref:Uncharacterized protein n=1 Tax=Streptomyces fradiae ATCC 10745 = DSM 40063 TaxID=1319510 RepID=A0A1Y2NXB5_STRFR|nr:MULTISPECIES: helix-turn-helix domain-containing protein [Streptomyces]KAF0649221.1 hypothetical protein K701_14030 [Streptomyces fradiae ATCC 10745 = DSM 40063]OSY51851.1 hypothetical protein BG846_02525 [Streptomyces fradiae ATCC 10745 = DSM 40063]QEV12003.1 DNA-binding protein [Streptomyces fradiae ATCC 10745 = DSM 40063]
MNTTAAAAQARVTVATIRTWCRRGVIAAVKAAGRWIIDAASLARRIEIGARRMPEPADTSDLNPTILRSIRRARLGYTPRRADRAALADRYVLAFPIGTYRWPSTFLGVNVWRSKGLLDTVEINGRHYYVLSARGARIRATLDAR